MIRAIIFDYFGVICSDEYWNIVKQDENIRSSFHSLANEVNLGKVHWSDFVHQVAAKTGRSEEEITQLYENEKIHPELIAYIAQLHSKYKIALLTNAHHEFLEPIIEKTRMKDVFDTVIMSSRVGLIKPDPRIFQKALDALHVEPHEAVFIDDVARNVVGAEEVGINAIVYESLDQLRGKLDKLGVNPDS